ncbi:MAG: molybdenum cofactor guanylyltransferase [Methanothrix sp.]|nr:molybdenum cofactor guanylyltransferase [Methanothrix sp.]
MRSAVILAGGNGRRLGSEKALLEFENRPLICWTAEKLSLAVDEVVVVARDEAHAERLQEITTNFALQSAPGVIFTWDRVAGFGPVAGLSAGMEKARGDFAFATGCDLPFLNPQVIERLFELVNEDEVGYDAAVPVQPNGFFEPLHCVYHREKMLSACERALEREERRIHAPLQELSVRLIHVDLLRPFDPDLLSFFNLNTREDLEEARMFWLASKKHQYLCKHECNVSDVVL